MELKNQVTNLKLSMELMSRGVNQESLFGWEIYDSGAQLKYKKDDRYIDHTNYAAFTVAENDDALPGEIIYKGKKAFLKMQKTDGNVYDYSYYEDKGILVIGYMYSNQADTGARLRIWLIKNKLIEI